MSNPLILIVDENISRGNSLKYFLGSRGFRSIQVFLTPEDCLYRLKKQPSPDFIITEHLSGNLSNLDFLLQTRETDHKIRMIVYSSIEDENHSHELLEAGATDYIVRATIHDRSLHELINNLNFIIKESPRML